MINFYEVLDCPPDRVSEEDIERLEMYEEQMSYPPRFELKFSPTGPKIRNSQVKLILQGLHEGSQDGPPVSHIVMLGNEDTGEGYNYVYNNYLQNNTEVSVLQMESIIIYVLL